MAKKEKPVEKDIKDIEKELDELLEKMTKINDSIEEHLKEDEEYQGYFKEAKKVAKVQIDKAEDTVILGTENGAMFLGTEKEIIEGLASLIHALVDGGDVDIEGIMEACVHGIADETGKGDMDKEKILLLLKVINESL